MMRIIYFSINIFSIIQRSEMGLSVNFFIFFRSIAYSYKLFVVVVVVVVIVLFCLFFYNLFLQRYKGPVLF